MASATVPAAVLVRRLHRLLWRSLLDFHQHQGFSQAAALAFYALLSFIPLIFLLLAVAGLVLGDLSGVRSLIDAQLKTAVPWLRDFLAEQLTRLTAQAPGLGLFSLGAMLWSSGLFFTGLQSFLHAPWFSADEAPPRWRHVLPWLAGPVLCLLLVVVMLVIHAWSWHAWLWAGSDWLPAEFIPPVRLPPWWWSWLTLAALVWSLYALLLPPGSHYGFSVFVSLALAGASKGVTLLFASLLIRLPSYYVMYGSLAGAALFLLWLDYNMMLILWGAHLIRLWHRARRNLEIV